MPDLDLDEAITAAYQELPYVVSDAEMAAAVKVVAVIVERQVRERIAAECDRIADLHSKYTGSLGDEAKGLRRAAAMARDGVS